MKVPWLNGIVWETAMDQRNVMISGNSVTCFTGYVNTFCSCKSGFSAFVAGSTLSWKLSSSSVALLGLKTDRFLQRTVHFLRGDELPNTGRWERELTVAQPALSCFETIP